MYNVCVCVCDNSIMKNSKTLHRTCIFNVCTFCNYCMQDYIYYGFYYIHLPYSIKICFAYGVISIILLLAAFIAFITCI